MKYKMLLVPAVKGEVKRELATVLVEVMIASPWTTRRDPHGVDKHTPHPRRGQPGGPLASALGPSLPVGEG
jgi:hypothetical protein